MEDPLGLIGTKIDDKYQVDAIVGEGGFAVVYKATHLLFRRSVAIKAFRALSDFGADARERLIQEFVQEGRLLAELSERSAAIVQARDIGTLTTPKGEWVPYMVLEWLEGRSLEQVVVDERNRSVEPRTLDQTIALLEPIAEALALAHKKGIAHRDIKPANIFILGDPRMEGYVVKLLDFGIAKVVQDIQKIEGSFQKTSGHLTSFTPAYGAPEQYSRTHGATGPWTDVFAFALVLVEVLLGHAALQGDSFVQLGYASADPARRPTPRTLGLIVEDAVESVFRKALAVAPEQRYENAAEMWMALREAAHMPSRATSFAISRTNPSPQSNTNPAPPQAAGSSGALASMRAGTGTALMPSQPPGPMSTAHTVAVPESPSVDAISKTNPKPGEAKGTSKVAAGAAALLAVASVGAAVFFVVHKGDKLPTTVPSASASVVASVPPKPACPEGMILIEGGEFFMGSNDVNAKDTEKPAHSVALKSYCIDRTEVTVEAYKACSDVGKCAPGGRDNVFDGIDDGLRKVIDPLCNLRSAASKAKHPVNCVDWEMAATFCLKQAPGGRLPTEAEWEFAARGPDGRAYPWGDEAPGAHYLNACGTECVTWGKKNRVEGKVTFDAMYQEDDGFPNTSPVGTFPDGHSRYGLEDVVGNVWEWTGDYFADYTKDPQKDPSGPKAGEDGRVARGGAWNGSDPSWVRPTFRFHFPAENRSYGVGFRCAAVLK